MKQILSKFAGDGVGARARRSAIWGIVEFGGSQTLRLAANLIMTRLLFPEAFGLMALVAVITTGLALFSDTGVGPSIIQSARGEDPDFLNTAWTIQAIRGVLLWLMTLVLAQPVAVLYDEPLLAQILPVAGFALLIGGLKPTSIYSVNRDLILGRFTRITLGSQVVALIIMVFLAWYLQSVWALVIGGVIASVLQTVAYHAFLPGVKNRLRFEREAFWQIFHFGKWLFLSTAAGFLINQGDRAILGLYISLEALGIYNIGYFLASAPLLLSQALQQKVIFPLYRMKPPSESAANRAALFRARRLLAFGLMSITGLLGFIGPPLIEFLYDPRYTTAGAIITLFTLSLMPMISLNTVTAAVMAAGDSRAMFIILGVTAFLQIVLLFFAVSAYGIPGTLASPGIAVLASYPLRLAYSRKYGVFDPIQDFGLTLLGFAVAGVACVLYWSEIRLLFTL
ncbi:MAG: oligosaccharide flippase family protein [Pseudomonadota bacterium]